MTYLILPKDVDSKFRFITVAAQRAKQLQNGPKARVEARSRQPTRVATQHGLACEALSPHGVFIAQFALGAEGGIRHVSLADAADLLLVAPATANTLGKFARGIADDALSTLFLATTSPVLVAPAMNVNMFRHPAVIENLEMLRARGVGIIEPGTGYLACGWLGEGRLAEVPEIVEAATAALQRRRSLEGESVVVTAGPTVEDIDPVRFISNRSSRRMGYRLAEAAPARRPHGVPGAGP